MVMNRATVKVDIKRNRLYCAWEGNVSKSDLDACFTEVRFCVADLKPGFSIVFDLTSCGFVYLEVISTYKRIVKYLMGQGVKEVVRIVNDEQLVRTQFSNLSLRLQGFDPVIVKTPEEAENYLENSTKRDCIRLNLLEKKVTYFIEEQPIPASLGDISAGGCGIETTAKVPENGQDIKVKFVLTGKKQQMHEFELEGRVVRHFQGGFALEFVPLSMEDKQMLLECITYESACEAGGQ